MKVLFFALVWPDQADDHMNKDLMGEFVARGHEIYVVTPWEKRRNAVEEYTYEDGMHVVRMPCGNIQKQKNKYIKVVNLFLLNIQIIKAICKYFKNVKFNLFLFVTPPITLGFASKYIKFKYKIPYYVLLKDIWPQDAVDAGAMKKGGLIWLIFRFFEKMTYRDADYIGCMSPANKKYILANNRYINPRKIEVCPNAISMRPLNKINLVSIRKKYSIPLDKVIFLFGGNLADAQGLDFLLDAITKLNNRTELYFLIIGSGTHYDLIHNRLERDNIKIAELRPPVRKEDFMNILQACDIGLIMLNKYFTVPNVPTKFTDYLKAGLPILCAVDKATDVGNIVVDAGCGYTCYNGEMNRFMESINQFIDDIKDKERFIQMKNNSQQLFLHDYTTSKAYNIIMNHFEVNNN